MLKSLNLPEIRKKAMQAVDQRVHNLAAGLGIGEFRPVLRGDLLSSAPTRVIKSTLPAFYSIFARVTTKRAAPFSPIPTGPVWLPTTDQPGIGDRSATRCCEADFTGVAITQRQYLLELIVKPNAFVVSGFQADIMPPNYGETLINQDVAEMIAYLLTLK